MSFKLTPKQQKANELLGSDARHIMLYGGSRSGKTLLLLRAIMTRALAVKSRHAVFRFRFSHVKSSVVLDTLPKMMELCFPGVDEHCKLDKSDWFYTLPNGSEIWFGGLDDKDRTEKILGQEHATIFLNECSQIPWASRNKAMTRIALKTPNIEEDGRFNRPLRLKVYYDCNPPTEAHWTYKLFIAKRSPDTSTPVPNPEQYAAFTLNPIDNQQNLDKDYLEELAQLPERDRRRFLLGQFGSASEGQLWTVELIEQQRFTGSELPTMQRVVVAVDPSGASGEEDERSDEIGIVVVGLGQDGKGYVLEDLSGRMGPADWGRNAVAAYDRHAADSIVAETNYGGAMVQQVIKAAAADANLTVPFREVKASRGKVVRAEPVSALFEQDKVKFAGVFPVLEDQLCGMTTAGYVGDKSPDRADAMVWGLTHLFPGLARREERFTRVPKVVLAYQNTKPRHNRQPRIITRR